MTRKLVAFFFLHLAFMVQSSPQAESPPRVLINSGILEGAHFGTSANEVMFLGVPYAQPPTGSSRWRPPEPIAKWQGVRNAASFGASCPQDPNRALSYTAAAKEYAKVLPYYKQLPLGEDCLFLNIWTTNLHGAQKAPVMVWIHGGGNLEGTGALPPLGPSLAREGVVLVSINYRLGALGFLAHPSLTAESPHHSSGNYGLLDQIAALQWTKQNIEQFGGDPENITILGESAGAVDACYLIASPLARGFFQRAILESNACANFLVPELKRSVPIKGMEESGEAAGIRFVHNLGIEGNVGAMAAMRAKSVDDITAATSANGFIGEVVDGWVLPQQPADTFAAGKEAAISIMVGSNADEAGMYKDDPASPRTMQQYREWLKQEFANQWKTVFQQYPVTQDKEVRTAFVALMTDYEFAFSTYFTAQAIARAGHRVYVYRFSYPAKGKNALLGAYHGLELSFLAGMVRKSYWGEFDLQDRTLSNEMKQYWVGFATRGARIARPCRNGRAMIWKAICVWNWGA